MEEEHTRETKVSCDKGNNLLMKGGAQIISIEQSSCIPIQKSILQKHEWAEKKP